MIKPKTDSMQHAYSEIIKCILKLNLDIDKAWIMTLVRAYIMYEGLGPLKRDMGVNEVKTHVFYF